MIETLLMRADINLHLRGFNLPVREVVFESIVRVIAYGGEDDGVARDKDNGQRIAKNPERKQDALLPWRRFV